MGTWVSGLLDSTPGNRADFFLIASHLATWTLQMLFFIVASTCKFDKVTDLAGALGFLLNTWLCFGLAGTYYPRQLYISVLVTVWGVRLGAYLFHRVLKRGKDDRFDELRNNCGKFFLFWVMQVFWVWVVSLPVTYVNAADVDVPLGITDYVGIAVWAIGFIFEAIADQTKTWHLESPDRAVFCSRDVWSISRHPNYFGEIMCWVGIFLCASAVFPANTYAGFSSVASPLLTMLLLMGVSGIPLGEKRYDEKFKENQNYWMYKRRTPPCIPCCPPLYDRLPNVTKLLFCCEFPCYGVSLEKKALKLSPENTLENTP